MSTHWALVVTEEREVERFVGPDEVSAAMAMASVMHPEYRRFRVVKLPDPPPVDDGGVWDPDRP